MSDLTPFQLFRLRLRGIIYAVAYFTTRRSFLGVRLSSWLKWAVFILTVLAWFKRQPLLLVILGVVLLVGIHIFYWYVKRQGYIHFLTFRGETHPEEEALLVDNKKVKTLATGTFGVTVDKNYVEAYVLQRPAEYWRVPIGDHAIMVQHQPGKYLYQFVQSGALKSVESGYLIFGRKPQKALAISFLTTWGPESANYTPSQFIPGSNHTPSRLERTIYLTFETAEACHQVRQNLLRDVGKPLHKPI